MGLLLAEVALAHKTTKSPCLLALLLLQHFLERRAPARCEEWELFEEGLPKALWPRLLPFDSDEVESESVAEDTDQQLSSLPEDPPA